MISLFLDTASFNLIVGIYKNLEQVYLKIEKNDNNLSEKVMIYIDEALKETNLSIEKIDNIFVVNGPGSFTGIRIGVTVAKTIAWGLKKKIYTISELELLATSPSKDYIVPMIDARRGFVYAGMYDRNMNVIIKNRYMSLEELYNKVKRHSKIDNVDFVSFDTIDSEKIKNITEPKLDIVKVISKNMNKQDINPHLVNPIYLKSTEAEENLKINV